MSAVVLYPAMPDPVVPDWAGSIWIGAIDVSEGLGSGVELADAAGYQRARLLVRAGRMPMGFIELDIHDSKLSVPDLERAIAQLPRAANASSSGSLPPISVVLCTRNRPEALRSAITSLLALNYPDLEIVIVDNASDTDASQLVVAAIADPRVSLVLEPRPGLARARNTGVLKASHEIIAFTDDDVVVDRDWLIGLMDGFTTSANVGCVCGIVPSGELRSFSQAYFDGRVTWARSCVPRLFELSSPPEGQPLFPFQVGQFGTGANFAMRRSVLVGLGGFDEALGVGSPTRGGEDSDIFVRTLLSGYGLVYQPSALVWHRHRAELSDLHKQIVGYGVGLGALIAKLLANPVSAPMVLRRAVRGVRHARNMTKVSVQVHDSAGLSSAKMTAVELGAIARGPLFYYRARLGGARKAPLLRATNQKDRRGRAVRRPDHAQQPLLRRLIRRIPEPTPEQHPKVQLLDLELSSGVDSLTGLDADVARILVFAHHQALGFVEVPCTAGSVSRAALLAAIDSDLGELRDEHLRLDGLESFDEPVAATTTPTCLMMLEPPTPAPMVSVVIATRDRAPQLARALESLQSVEYPAFEVLVVDNAPSDDATRNLLTQRFGDDSRIRYIGESLPGASRARNIGALAGRGEIVAFTDDDVVVDRLWLKAVVAAFRDHPDVEVVGGLTVPGHLDTPAQRAFELYGGMARGHRRRVYDLLENRGDTLLYPYTAGIFGASNNAAFRRVGFLDNGGFDLTMGPATPVYSAEDLDAFLKVILAGQKILYEPRALVRHEHRREFADLYWQVFTYSTGSSALLVKLGLQDVGVARDLVRRLPKLLPAALLRAQRSGAEAGVGAYPAQLRWLERAGYMYGPVAYARSRWWARREG